MVIAKLSDLEDVVLSYPLHLGESQRAFLFVLTRLCLWVGENLVCYNLREALNDFLGFSLLLWVEGI